MSNQILAYHLSTIPWNMYMEFKLQVTSFWKETSFFDPHLTPWMKIKIQNLIAHLQVKIYPFISYSFICLLVETEMEFNWHAFYDRKRHCSTLIWPQGAKCKFRILIAYLQDMSNHILGYQLSAPENVNVV